MTPGSNMNANRFDPITGQPTGVVVDYRRISKFRVDAGAGHTATALIGVERQGEDNARAVELRGLGPIARTFQDNNQSASKYRRKERQDWPELLEFIRSGAVSFVVFWVVDRIIRDTDDQSALLAACREGGALILQSHNNQTVDPHDPEAVMVFKILGAVAEADVARASMKIRRQKVAAANAGRFHGGRRRFGYELGFRPSDPTDPSSAVRAPEAEIVRQLAARLLAGESLRSLLDWLHRSEIPAVSGKPWRTSSLRQMLMSPHLAGLRVHHGNVLEGVTAQWPAILDRGTHEALVALLSDPKRRTTTTNARKHLLTGLARCGVCHAGLQMRSEGGRTRLSYACRLGGHVQRPMAAVDLYVTEAVIGWLELADETGAFAAETDGTELAHVQAAYEATVARHTKAGRDYATGKITDETLALVATAVEEEKTRLGEELARLKVAARRPQAALEGMTGRGARKAFTEAPLGRQRAILETVLSALELHPSSGSRERFDPRGKHMTLEFTTDGAAA